MTAGDDILSDAAGRGAPPAGVSRPAPLYRDGGSERNSAAMPPRRAFVGRDRELDEVAGAFDDALAGRGALFLLVGGAAIGKTRLADELTRRAELRGIQPLWGRCWETGGAPAYWPWIQILREVARDRPKDELWSVQGSGRTPLPSWCPNWLNPAALTPRSPTLHRRGVACSTP